MAELQARFWSNVQRTPSGCWIWQRWRSANGYGHTAAHFGWLTETSRYAHRVAWCLANDELCVPDGKVILHTCGTPACCNPLHLRAATHRENTRGMMAKGRHVEGNLSTKRKLTGRKLSVTTRNRMSVAKLGGNHPRATAVLVDGVEYACASVAARELGISRQCLHTRLNSANFPNYIRK